MTPKPTKSPLDDAREIKRIDKSEMIQFSVEAAKHYAEAGKLSKKISINYPKPENIIVAGMGGSGIGGELLKDYARNQTNVPIEVSRDYTLPAYAGKRTLVVTVSYSGDTEETLSSFHDALTKKCMIFCISSGGSLLEFAEKLNVPYLQIPSGMPPRAASPYLLLPQLILIEKIGLLHDISKELDEATKMLAKLCRENAPEKLVESNQAKSLASALNGTVPVIYSFGIYRSVAQRWKQQFNENAKIPAKWEFFSELNHNEIVGWQNAESLAECFSTVFLREKNEPPEVRSRIEITKELMQKNSANSKQFEVWARGKGTLTKMLSNILVGDFTSVYLAILRKVDPTPVETINILKMKLAETGKKEKIIHELEKLKPVKP
jgi:glucose/mannose-6-phosphate isomerase